MSNLPKTTLPAPMYQAKQTSQYKKDVKRLIKQGKDMRLLGEVVDALIAGKTLDARYS